MEELGSKLVASRETGLSDRSVDDIFAEAREIAQRHSKMRE